MTVAAAGYFTWDLLAVVAFVLLGRDSHDEALDVAGTLRTAAPFLIGVAAAWLAPQVRAHPERIAMALLVAAVTTAVGLVVRRVVFTDGISGAFPIIAAGFIAAFVILGRLIGARLQSGRA